MIEIAGIRVNDFFRFVFGLYSVEKKKSYQSLCNLDMVKGGLLPPLSTACLPSQSRSDAPICVCR